MEEKKEKKGTLGNSARIVGIAGVGNGVGATHFSVMLLNYLAGFRRREAALLEWNASGDLQRMEWVCTGMCRSQKPFRILEADYYKKAGSDELAKALGRNYKYILIDFGNAEKADWSEFLRCGRQFLIGSFSEWQQEKFREFEKEKAETGKKSWTSLAVFGSEETRREFKRRFRLSTERIPFSADPFSVTSETRDFFDRLLTEKNK